MELKIAEGKTLEKTIEFLELHLPESISQDEIEDIADLIHNARNNKIIISDEISIETVMNMREAIKYSFIDDGPGLSFYSGPSSDDLPF